MVEKTLVATDLLMALRHLSW